METLVVVPARVQHDAPTVAAIPRALVAAGIGPVTPSPPTVGRNGQNSTLNHVSNDLVGYIGKQRNDRSLRNETFNGPHRARSHSRTATPPPRLPRKDRDTPNRPGHPTGRHLVEMGDPAGGRGTLYTTTGQPGSLRERDGAIVARHHPTPCSLGAPTPESFRGRSGGRLVCASRRGPDNALRGLACRAWQSFRVTGRHRGHTVLRRTAYRQRSETRNILVAR